jgi:hypothetical protein
VPGAHLQRLVEAEEPGANVAPLRAAAVAV